jgi:hypothetical protein
MPAGNSVQHRFQPSDFAVIRLEDKSEIADLKADLVACYKPVNSEEIFAIERIALYRFMILRGARLEAGLFTTALDMALDRYDGYNYTPMHHDLAGDGDIEITRGQNRNYALAEGFRRMVKDSDAWNVLLRYQQQAERQYRRAVEDFERIRKLRPELPNEPGLQPQPEQPEDYALLSEVNSRLPDRPADGKGGTGFQPVQTNSTPTTQGGTGASACADNSTPSEAQPPSLPQPSEIPDSANPAAPAPSPSPQRNARAANKKSSSRTAAREDPRSSSP